MVVFLHQSTDNTNKFSNYRVGFGVEVDGKEEQHWPIKKYAGFKDLFAIGDFECSQFDDRVKRQSCANYKNMVNASCLFIRYRNWKGILENSNPKVI